MRMMLNYFTKWQSFFIILYFLCLLVAIAIPSYAQIPQTPNLKLDIPLHNTQNWDQLMNYNFSLLDNYLSGVQPLPDNLNVLGNVNVGGTLTCGSGCSGGGGSSLPVINVMLPPYNATGLGPGNDDTPAFNAAVAACPTNGCLIVLPVPTVGYSVTGVNFGTHNNVTIWGLGGPCVKNSCSVIIQGNGATDTFVFGNGSTPVSGIKLINVGFQDMTGNGTSAMHFQAVRGATFEDVGVYNYSVGAPIFNDGGSNFGQYFHVVSFATNNSKFFYQTAGKTASVTVDYADINCTNSAGTDVIAGSIAFDIGYTYHTASTGTGSENWFGGYGVQNCQIGAALWNAGGNHFLGKLNEITVVPRAAGSYGAIVDGDTSSLASNNQFFGAQPTGVGTAYWLKPNTTNTTIVGNSDNGTAGVGLVVDSGALGTSLILTNKRWTGWTTNIATMSRSGNIVTAVTTANGPNGTLSVTPGTLLFVYNSTGGATSFNSPAGGFSVASVTTNDTTAVTTLTWNQTGGNESATINTGACGGAGTCISALSTITTSGVGVAEFTGNQFTQDVVDQQPAVPVNQTLPTVSVAGTGRRFFDGTRYDCIQNNGGVLHCSDGPLVTFNGTFTGSYTPQPTTTAGAGVTGVPACSVSTGNVCQTSDDKGTVIATNSNGSTWCAPPTGNGTGYPPTFSQKGAFLPGSAVPTAFWVTLAGHTSPLGFACPGTTTATLNGGTASVPLTYGQSGELKTNGTNWYLLLGASPTPVDSLLPGISPTNAVNIEGASYVAGGSTATYGSEVYNVAGNSNSTAVGAGDLVLGTGQNNATGLSGSYVAIQSLATGVSTTGKEGGLVRFCHAFDGSDCSNSGIFASSPPPAIRLAIPDSGDTSGMIGIVYSGASIGNMTRVQFSGLFPPQNDTQYYTGTHPGVPVTTSCTVNQFVESSQTASAATGQMDCTSTDSPKRVGYAATASSGTCSVGSPCYIKLWIKPY